MSKNDAMLYSGMTSPARREAVKAREEVVKLDPKAEAVLELIASEKASLTHVHHIVIDASVPDDIVRRQLQQTRDQYEFLNRLERRMKQLLNVRVTKEQA